MRKTDLLRGLQELDTALDRARLDLEQCRFRLGDDSELVPLREEMESTGRQLKTLQEKGRELDWDLQDRTARLKDQERKLYGGTVKSPKDLTSLSQEVEHERRQISQVEDKALMNMDAVEDASQASQRATRTYTERERAWQAEQAALEKECASLSQQVAELEQRRRQAAAPIDAPTLRLYESIRRTRGGVAVVAVEQRACQGCRISLSSSEVQRARASTEPVLCQSCGRILYVP